MTTNTYNNGTNKLAWIINDISDIKVEFTHFRIIFDKITNEI